MNILARTKSICGECGRLIPAEVFEKNKRIFIITHCSKHGDVISDHVWDDPEIYKGLKKIRMSSGKAMQVIVDVTNKCNLNCRVCFARANEHQNLDMKMINLDLLKDYRQIFLSGGEPTTREDLPEIMLRCIRNGQKPILFTNGVKLANIAYLKKLKKSGLRSVLLQFDTLNDENSKYIRGNKLVEIKKKALKNLAALNIPTSVWTVVVKGKNDKDLAAIHRYVLSHPNIKTVSAIPIWRVGRYNEDDFVPPSSIIEELGKIYGIDKQEFVDTTEFVCNIDRLQSIFAKKRGKLFTVCMIKALVFETKGEQVSFGQVFNLPEINRRINQIFNEKSKTVAIIKFIGYFITREVIINYFKNKYLRKVAWRSLFNLRFLLIKRYLLLNPFRFITVGIFPNKNNIDRDFLRACNTYSLTLDDYSLKPACLHYIEQDRKTTS
jgi:MoaA/NifB/PqqE/SkfB family radical SAM enzyme